MPDTKAMALPTRFFHGSHDPFEPDFLLAPRGAAYEADWKSTDFYAALERHRPADRLAHAQAVFLVGDPDDVDLAGGSTEWCLEVEPVGAVTRHDLNWGSEVSSLVSDGHDIDSRPVREAAEAYWRGDRHPDESVWEYLCAGARVLRCEPWETFDIDQGPSAPGR